MKDITKKYSNGEVTIIWKPSICSHSTICWRGEHSLPEVFNPAERPWIKPEGASTERIIAQVKQCPSGALSFVMNTEEKGEVSSTSAEYPRVEVSLNGPLLLRGTCVVIDSTGSETIKENITAFCRCGHSANKPYCDGSHKKIGFVG